MRTHVRSSCYGTTDEETEVLFVKNPLERSLTSPPSYSAIISKTRDTPEYAEFSLPDFFIVFVRKSTTAIAYFREQFRDDSIFSSWLNIIENDLNKTEFSEE